MRLCLHWLNFSPQRHRDLLPLTCCMQTSPLGGRAFPVPHHPRSPHPGRKPRGNKFSLHTHSDKYAFTSQGWKINPYRIRRHSSQELYTKTKGRVHISIKSVCNSIRHIHNTSLHTNCIWTKGKKRGTDPLNSSCLTSYLSKSKQSLSIVGKFLVPLLFQLNFQRPPLPSPKKSFLLILFFSPISPFLHHSADQYQNYNDDEQLALRKGSWTKFLSSYTYWWHLARMWICLILSLHICKWGLCTGGSNLHCVTSSSSKYKYPAPKYINTSGSSWVTL